MPGLVALLVGALLFTGSEAAAATPAEPQRLVARIGLCVLEAPPGAERALASLADRAREILPRLESELGTRPAGRYRIFLIPPGAVADSEIARLDEGAPPWAAGYMIPQLRVGAIRLAQASQYPYGTVETVFAHEVTHLLNHDASGGRLPRWLDEGLATWQGRRWGVQDMVVYSQSLLTNDLPPLAELDASFEASAEEARLAYAASFGFVSRAMRRHGPSFAPAILRAAARRPLAEAWAEATGGALADAESEWRRESLIRYRWLPILTASSTLWVGISLLAAAAGVRRRARAREARERWPEPEEWVEPVETAEPVAGAGQAADGPGSGNAPGAAGPDDPNPQDPRPAS